MDDSASVPISKPALGVLYALTNSDCSAPLVDSSARNASPDPIDFLRIRNREAAGTLMKVYLPTAWK
jgi:hypothetical protein